MRLLLFVLLAAIGLLSIGLFGLYLRSEAQRCRQRAVTDRQALRAEQATRADIEQRLARGSDELAKARQRIKGLEAELETRLKNQAAVTDLIDKTTAALTAERERHKREMFAAKKFMPEGLRQALITLNQLLRQDGQSGLRFLKATKIDAQTLFGVQFLDHDPGTLSSTIYLADELRFELDRGKGTMTLAFAGGFRRGPAGRLAFPDSGHRLVLADVDGRSWEERLPFLVVATGDYKESIAKATPPRMLPRLRATWRGRLNDLLVQSTTQTRYKLDRFRDLKGARFADALLVGYDKGKKLCMSVEARHLWVEVDETARSVELRMTGGTLRQVGGESDIPDGGYRIQLPGVEPDKALEAMLGMVIRK